MNQQNTYRNFIDEDLIYEKKGILEDKERLQELCAEHGTWAKKEDQEGSQRGKPCGSLWLIPVVFTHFWLSAVCVLLGPFFPPLASSTGLEQWKFGFVFSAHKIGFLVGSALSSYVSTPRTGYLAGQIGTIVGSVLIGSLYWIRDANTLLGFSMVFALFSSTMVTMYFCCMYAVLMAAFEDRAGILIAAMEFLFGLGAMAGSWFGGFLVDMWAFPLPFFAMSGFLIVSCPFMTCVRLGRKQKSLKTEEDTATTPSYRGLLLSPAFIVDMATGALPLTMAAFNEDTLEPYLRQFHLSETKVGSVFTVQLLGYCAGSIVSGVFSRYKLDSCLMLLGTALCCISYLIIGPAPFMERDPNLNWIYIAMVLSGFAMAPQFICGYIHGQRTAVRIGYPDNIRTSTVTSSIFFSALCLSSVGTAPLAGYMVSIYGYQTSSVGLSGFLLFWTIVLCMLCASDLRDSKCTKRGKEYQKIGEETTQK